MNHCKTISKSNAQHPVIFLFSFLFIFNFSLFAQDTIPKQDTTRKGYSLGQFTKETGMFLSKPFHLSKKEWLMIGGMAVITFSSTLLDQPVRDATQGEQRFYNSVPIEGGRLYGEPLTIPAVAGVFAVYGLAFNKDKSKVIAIELVQAALFSEAATYLFKIAVGRARPYMNEGVYSLHPFSLKGDFNSFPSGHTTGAWALSAVIAGTASSDIVKILAYVPAGFTMFSRIYQDKHWISDSFAGAFVGYFVGNWVVNLHQEKKNKITVTSMFPPTISISLN